MAASPQPRRSAWPLAGVGLLALAAAPVALNSGGIVFVGPLFILLAPDLFLAGAVLVVLAAASPWLGRGVALWVVAVPVAVLLAFNTRTGALLQDLLAMPAVTEQLGHPRKALASQPLHVVYAGDKLAARKVPWRASAPRCRGDGCFATEGFRRPARSVDYWQESPAEAVRAVGFALAREGERAPTLEVRESVRGHVLWVDLRLLDEDGRPQALARYRYRNGFPGVPPDLESMSEDPDAGARLDFLLHGNSLARGLGDALQRSPAHPVRSFLAATFELRAQAWAHGVLPSGQEAVTVQPLEVLQEQVFEPMIVVGNANGAADATPWRQKSWDAQRSKFCDTLLKREPGNAGGGTVQVWWLFAQDPTGRRKMRRTGHELCEPDAIWSWSYVETKDSVTIARYTSEGELRYRLAFSRPAPIHGFAGAIQARTFRAESGYLVFEWVDVNWSGRDLQVKRHMLVRVKEPPPAR